MQKAISGKQSHAVGAKLPQLFLQTLQHAATKAAGDEPLPYDVSINSLFTYTAKLNLSNHIKAPAKHSVLPVAL